MSWIYYENDWKFEMIPSTVNNKYDSIFEVSHSTYFDIIQKIKYVYT